MSYSYETEKANLFTEDGVKLLRSIEAVVDQLLESAGAFRAQEVLRLSKEKECGSSFTELACLEYLVKEGKIVCVRNECWAQYKVYSTGQVHLC